jgi:hypothetical protein
MKSVTIYWQPAQGRCVDAGHGLLIFAGPKYRREHLAAFVAFNWPDGYGSKPVVHFDPALMPPDKQQFAAFKAAIEARIRAGDLGFSELGYWSRVNG